MNLPKDTLLTPPNFLQRFEDRRLIAAGKSQTKVESALVWELCLFKAWQEYATSHNDRHPLASAELDPTDPTIATLEEYLGWPGEPGAFVTLAVDAGFLSVETDADGKHWLVLYGFFPLNKHLHPSTVGNQAMGGYGKQAKKAERLANADAGKQLNLLMRDQESVLVKTAATPAEKEAAVALVRNLYGLLGQAPPAQGFGAIMDRCLEDALHIIRYEESDDIDKVKMAILMRHKQDDATLPRDPERLLKEWNQLK